MSANLYEKILCKDEKPTRPGWYDTDRGNVYWWPDENEWSCRDDIISEEYPKWWLRPTIYNFQSIEEWKNEMIAVWADVDKYARNHKEIGLGESVSSFALNLMKDRDEMKANAKLMAAAPELLHELIKAKNALSVFLERHSWIINKDWQDAFKAGIEAMDLAIKKATG